MNRQHIFNTAYEGLQAQGFQRSVHNSHCRYRRDDGLKCAIGHCLSDESYNPDMDRYATPVRDLVDEYPKAARDLGHPNSDDESFLTYLQSCHDDGLTPEQMKRNLHQFAENCGLEVPS